MTRRKGELSANKIGRERPEQVAVEVVAGERSAGRHVRLDDAHRHDAEVSASTYCHPNQTRPIPTAATPAP